MSAGFSGRRSACESPRPVCGPRSGGGPRGGGRVHRMDDTGTLREEDALPRADAEDWCIGRGHRPRHQEATPLEHQHTASIPLPAPRSRRARGPRPGGRDGSRHRRRVHPLEHAGPALSTGPGPLEGHHESDHCRSLRRRPRPQDDVPGAQDDPQGSGAHEPPPRCGQRMPHRGTHRLPRVATCRDCTLGRGSPRLRGLRPGAPR